MSNNEGYQEHSPLSIMHREEIKSTLRQRGVTLAALAKSLEMRPETVCNVIASRGRSTRIEQAVAETIEQPLHIVFPDRYPAPTGAAIRTITLSGDDLDKVRATLVHAIEILDHAKTLPIAV
jgi:lambda repressor-like predicted transcriptional regulator